MKGAITVSSLSEYFHTDWAAMTTQDWVGTILTVVVFVLMVALYFYVWRPANREDFEARRFLVFEDDEDESGEKR